MRPIVSSLTRPFLFASLTVLSGCMDLLGAPVQDTLPRPTVAPSAEAIAADPCHHGDVRGCSARCEQHHDAASCHTVGVLLEYGAAEDHSGAAAYYGRACGAAYGPGCTGLAWLHLLGRGARKDAPLAMKLFTRAYDGYRLACLEGTLEGCFMAADMLIEGRGVEADEALALTLLDGACSKGENRACDRARSLR